MNDLVTMLMVAAVFLLFGTVALIATGFALFFYIRNRIRFRRTMLLNLGHSLGLVVQDQGGMPVLQGQIDGLDVIVDVVYNTYIAMSVGASRKRVRAWTRVRAKLPVAPPIHVRCRKQELYDQTPKHLAGWSLTKTRDARFDQHFEVFTDDQAYPPVTLSTHQQKALLDAESVHVRKGAAEWLQFSMPKDIAAFESVVLACVRVAASFKQQTTFATQHDKTPRQNTNSTSVKDVAINKC